jgi:hypothetical protein
MAGGECSIRTSDLGRRTEASTSIKGWERERSWCDVFSPTAEVARGDRRGGARPTSGSG